MNSVEAVGALDSLILLALACSCSTTPSETTPTEPPIEERYSLKAEVLRCRRGMIVARTLLVRLQLKLANSSISQRTTDS